MSAHTSARKGSTVGCELALRAERSAQAQIATDGATCATRREAGVLVLTAGPAS
jgi:hypothetical protein